MVESGCILSHLRPGTGIGLPQAQSPISKQDTVPDRSQTSPDLTSTRLARQPLPMGIYDRDYAYEQDTGGGLFGRPGQRRRGMGPASQLSAWSANTWIIAANIAVHLLRMFALQGGSKGTDVLARFGHFSSYEVSWPGGLEFWRFLTFQFLHAPGLAHVGFNMLGLYMFGSLVEGHLGKKKYLAFYLTCGVFGALLYLILNGLGMLVPKGGIPFLLFSDPRTPLVGASAGVFGVIMACAYIAPDTIVQLLFPPVSMRMKVMAYAYVGLALLNLAWGGNNQGGDAAHIGGAIAGYFFIRNSHLLRDFFDVFGDSRKPKTRPKGKPPALKLIRGDDSAAPSDAEVDRILAKVKDLGKDSLTPQEVDALRRATNARKAADSQ
jgi:membrane associated rhomboid family serine protease